MMPFGHESGGGGRNGYLRGRSGSNEDDGRTFRGERSGSWEKLRKKYGLSDNADMMVVKAGEPIKIKLQVVGSPEPTVTWWKDKKMLQHSNRV